MYLIYVSCVTVKNQCLLGFFFKFNVYILNNPTTWGNKTRGLSLFVNAVRCVETVFYLNHNFKNQRVLWYCISFCGCGLKKVVLQEILLVEVCLVFIYVWLTLWLKLRLNKK